jgi:hypothetical protein
LRNKCSVLDNFHSSKMLFHDNFNMYVLPTFHAGKET